MGGHVPLERAQTTGAAQNRSFRPLWAVSSLPSPRFYGLGLASAVLVEDRTHSSAQTGARDPSAILPSFLPP